MNQEHKHYERQSALAAVGQLTEAEVTELEHHAVTCTSCSHYLAEMARISRICFLLHAGKTKERVPEGMQQRFIERAAHAGIPIGTYNSGLLYFRSFRLAAIAFLLCIAASFSWKAYHIRTTSPQSMAETNARLSQPGGTRGANVSSLENQPIATQPMKVTQPKKRTAERYLLSMTTGKPKDPKMHPSAHLVLDWPQQGLPILYAAPRFASTIHLVPDARFLACVKHIADCRSGVRAFPMDSKLLSFAYLETPGSPDEGTSRIAPKFSAPEFPLRFTRSW